MLKLFTNPASYMLKIYLSKHIERANFIISPTLGGSELLEGIKMKKMCTF